VGELKKIYGKVIDRSKNPIKGAIISYGEDTTFSNKDGEFNLLITPSPLPTITITTPGFGEVIKEIYKRSGELKENLGIIRLKSNKEEFQEEISGQINLDKIEINRLNLSNSNFEQLQQKKLRDLIKTLKYTLTPIILNLLLNFGITKISEAISKKSSKPTQCPDRDRLKKLVDKRNKLVKQLNITFNTIDITLKSLGVLQGLLTGVEVALKLIPLIPFPSPPAPSLIGGELNTQVKKYKNINGGIIVILFILRSLLSKILLLLESLDFQIQSCIKDSPEIELESLNSEIVEQINSLNRDTSIPTELVNGFSFDIETEQTTDELKRKRAVAKNSKGVILLRGEYSYSSSTQILIEELIFNIKVNNLKAD
jgi:putative Mn2+ efflux pump MntP